MVNAFLYYYFDEFVVGVDANKLKMYVGNGGKVVNKNLREKSRNLIKQQN